MELVAYHYARHHDSDCTVPRQGIGFAYNNHEATAVKPGLKDMGVYTAWPLLSCMRRVTILIALSCDAVL